MVEWDLWFIGSGVSLKIPRESDGDFAGINYSPVKHRSARHDYGVCYIAVLAGVKACGVLHLSFLTVLSVLPYFPSCLSRLSAGLPT